MFGGNIFGRVLAVSWWFHGCRVLVVLVVAVGVGRHKASLLPQEWPWRAAKVGEKSHTLHCCFDPEQQFGATQTQQFSKRRVPPAKTSPRVP